MALLALSAVLAVGGCSFDAAEGTRFAGQRCFDDAECAEGLTCIERVCRPVGGGTGARPDTGGGTDGGPDTGLDAPSDTAPDAPMVCEPLQRRCTANARFEQCTPDGSGWREETCPEAMVCRGGDCIVPPTDCRDRDGDTYGTGCRRGPDCDDTDPDVHPERAEVCSTPYDDNCNQQSNENCETCCAGGCGDGQFCDQCQCRPFDPDVCQYQLQPCEREGRNNGFLCTEFGDRLRCLATCDKTVDDPASTCPAPNSRCIFGDDQRGACVSACDPDSGCGGEGLGCLLYGDGTTSSAGICVPTDESNELGDRCDPDVFFDCEEGAMCVQANRRGARCVEACRPFAGPGTDCPTGEGYCMPLNAEMGMCRPSTGRTEGQSCSPGDVYDTCSDDAVACFPPGGNRDASCYRLCRLGDGFDDCVEPGTRCNATGPDEELLGVCY